MTTPSSLPTRWHSPSRSALQPGPAVSKSAEVTYGRAAARVFGEQLQRILKREPEVLRGQDPEALHQMRVASRRLRAALVAFGPAVRLPAAARERRVRELTRVLGRLRDLEVQAGHLREEYGEKVSSEAREAAEGLLKLQDKAQRKARVAVHRILAGGTYARLKEAYRAWLEAPRFTALGALPLRAVCPDLLSPFVATLLLHPAWQLDTRAAIGEAAPVLHDLRKQLKRTRYVAEFFRANYGEDFAAWIRTLRELQDRLGEVQDGEVLLTSLAGSDAAAASRRALHAGIRRRQLASLAGWEAARQRYLDLAGREELRRMILEPHRAGGGRKREPLTLVPASGEPSDPGPDPSKTTTP